MDFLRALVLIGPLLIGFVPHSAAMEMGRIAGAAWIGQPLDLSISLQLDNRISEASAAMCAQADVFDGDQRKDPAGVHVSVEAGSSGAEARVRVTTTSPIEEAVVTLYVRAGCEQKVARRYVMLAEFRADPQANGPLTAPVVPVVAVTQSTSAPPVTSAASATSVTSSSAATTPPTATTASTSTPSAPAKPANAVSAPQANIVARAPQAAAVASTPQAPAKSATITQSTVLHTKPHLTLEPVEPTAQLAAALASLPAKTSSALQRNASGPDQEATQQAQMLALQADLKRLLDQANTNERALTALRKRVELEQTDALPAWLPYLMMILLAASLIMLLWVGSRHAKLLAQHAKLQREARSHQ